MCVNLRSGIFMRKTGLFMELAATYRKHGWELRLALTAKLTNHNYSQTLQSATRKSMHSGSRVHLTTIVKHGSCACWHKLPTRFLKRLNRRKLKRNATKSNRKWKYGCASTLRINELHSDARFRRGQYHHAVAGGGASILTLGDNKG